MVDERYAGVSSFLPSSSFLSLYFIVFSLFVLFRLPFDVICLSLPLLFSSSSSSLALQFVLLLFSSFVFVLSNATATTLTRAHKRARVRFYHLAVPSFMMCLQCLMIIFLFFGRCCVFMFVYIANIVRSSVQPVLSTDCGLQR